MTQASMLPAKRTFVFDIDYRPILGIYKEHAMIDLMEARALITASEEGVLPKKIDTKALFAVFGNDTFFSVLKDHLRLFEVIRSKLATIEYKAMEDYDQTSTYHPDLRRIGQILLQKTQCIETADHKLHLSSLLTNSLD